MKSGDIYVSTKLHEDGIRICHVLIEPYPSKEIGPDGWRAHLGFYKDEMVFLIHGTGLIAFDPNREDFIFINENLSIYEKDKKTVSYEDVKRYNSGDKPKPKNGGK